MPSNRNKQNAFYYFMLDWRKQEEKKGCVFNNMKEVQSDPKLNQAWRNLTSNEKLIYKEKERNCKLKQNLNKKTNLGESVDELLQIQIREKDFHNRMKEYISSIIKEAKRNNSVYTLKFYVIHVNYYCMYNCESPYNYSPAEIALVEFSLGKGVMRSYQKIINSEIKKGYAYEVNIHSNSSHQIPREPDFGEKNYGQIFKEICQFVRSNKENERLPPLFTLFNVEQIKNSVMSVINLLANFDQECNDNFDVYSFEELFVNLYNNLKAESDNAIDEVIVSLQIKKDPFNYKTSLCCDFHKIGCGGNFCSKSIVQRWIFVLFSYVCSLLKINLIPGYHMPIENLDFNDGQELNRSFAALNIFGDTRNYRLPSNWNSNNTTKSPSERTYRDEEVRKSQSKPLIIYQGSFKHGSTKHSISSHEQSYPLSVEDFQSDRSVGIHIPENKFSSIGRGVTLKRYIQKNNL
ncbi:protein maelstrom homolog [Phymastichus coffea]|uniref:protein maelstrom homolog n=1 Tax=Phymastichus coffea TaxID=108790 RepID=UPI00273B6B22|nr:protein maelstrom homolog [Phymastichus coffea]XP_058805011.1 protein maelstrom homolog [Phymastichus coffea]XP_058805012.1 protein maelstrom homolog [Phymastichus coffea]